MSLARPSPRSLAAAVLAAAAALAVTLTAPAAQPAQAAVGGLTWSDEFTGAAGTAPDSAKWVLETGGGGWGNSELEYYTNSTQPDLNQLQPVPDNSNPNFIVKGNPDLLPTFSHTFNMDMYSFKPVSGRNMWGKYYGHAMYVRHVLQQHRTRYIWRNERDFYL